MDITSYDHHANEIAASAEVETLDTYEDRIEYYKEQQFTYIPIPSDSKYYETENDTLEDLHEDQIIPETKHLAEILALLKDHPFLLIDIHYPRAYAVREGNEIVRQISFNPKERDDVMDRLQREAEDNEEILFLSELRDRYPDLVDSVSGVHSTDDPEYENQYLMITLADLNKRAFREMLYRLLHELESNLSDKIQAEYPDSEDILKDVRAPSIGRWKKDQVSGLHLHVAEHLNIIDIMQVVQASSSSFVDECGFTSKNDVQESLGRIDKIRNRVMHSSRSLVYGKEDVTKVVEVIETTERILSDMN